MSSRLFAVAFLLISAAYADQVVMKNGDRVSGSIVKKDAAQLTIKSVHFGTVILPWDQIDSLTADKPLTVVLPTKSVEGPLTAAGGQAVVINKETVAIKDIVALRDAEQQKAYLRLLRPKITELWTMTGNVGFAGASGNARTHTITVPLNFVRATNDDKITASFNLIRSAARVNGASAQTADAVRGGWAYNRNLDSKVFVSTVNNYEYDKFQNLDLRAIFGGGLGAHAWKSEHGFVDFTAGGDYNHEAFTDAARSLGEVYWGDNIGWKPTKKLSFTQSYRMFNDVTNTGAFRQNADFAMSIAVNKHFTWNASTSDRYLTNPAPGRGRNDLLYSTGFGFQFAR